MAAGYIGFNHFPETAARIKPACQKIVKEVTLFTQSAVQSGAAVRTGFMQSNVYAVTPDGTSTYGQGVGPPTDDVYLLPEVRPDDDMTGIVGCAADYSIYVEMGTRFMAAEPFFYPGVEAGGVAFDMVNLEVVLRV